MRFSLPLSIALGLSLAATASAATIGIVAPQSGPYAILGAQLRSGAKAALTDAGHQILEINETCEADSATPIAEQLVNGKAEMAIGFLCSESLTSGIEFLAASNIPVITLSSRVSTLIEDAQKYNWPLFRMAPSMADEARAAVDAIIARWKGMPIALVDDGTIYSRELIDSIRMQLENYGLKPSFVDTIRPGQDNQLALVRRLSKLSIAHLFIAADRNDVAIVARNSIENKTPLNVMSGEAMKAANSPVPTPAGTLAVVEPDYRSMDAASPVVATIETSGTIADGYVLPSYAAMQIAQNALTRASTEQQSTTAILSSSSFETILGAIRFNEQKGLNENPFRLQQWNGETFVDPVMP